MTNRKSRPPRDSPRTGAGNHVDSGMLIRCMRALHLTGDASSSGTRQEEAGGDLNVTHTHTHAGKRQARDGAARRGGASRLSRSFRGAADRGLCSRPAQNRVAGILRRSSIPLPRHLPPAAAARSSCQDTRKSAARASRAQPPRPVAPRCAETPAARPCRADVEKRHTDRTVID